MALGILELQPSHVNFLYIFCAFRFNFVFICLVPMFSFQLKRLSPVFHLPEHSRKQWVFPQTLWGGEERPRVSHTQRRGPCPPAQAGEEGGEGWGPLCPPRRLKDP